MTADLRSRVQEAVTTGLDALLAAAAGEGAGLAAEQRLREGLAAAFADLAAHPERLDDAPGAVLARLQAEVGARSHAPAPAAGDPGSPCVRPAASGWVAAYFGGSLPPASEPGLFGHLGDCAACRRAYGAALAAEGGGERRRLRLTRGLPWSLLPGGDPEPALVPAPLPEAAPAPADPDAAPVSPWPRRLSLLLAAVMAIGAGLLFWLGPRGRPGGAGDPVAKAPPDPDQGLEIALLRYDAEGEDRETPWQVVMGDVAADDRLSVIYMIERGPAAHLVIVARDDRGRLTWILPPGGTAPRATVSVPVAAPAEATRLAQEITPSAGARRVTVHAILGPRPLAVDAVIKALADLPLGDLTGRGAARLALPGTRQARASVSVLP
jgi:hypothetical protein